MRFLRPSVFDVKMSLLVLFFLVRFILLRTNVSLGSLAFARALVELSCCDTMILLFRCWPMFSGVSSPAAWSDSISCRLLL